MQTPLTATTKVPRTMEGYLRRSGSDQKQSMRTPAVQVNKMELTKKMTLLLQFLVSLLEARSKRRVMPGRQTKR